MVRTLYAKQRGLLDAVRGSKLLPLLSGKRWLRDHPTLLCKQPASCMNEYCGQSDVSGTCSTASKSIFHGRKVRGLSNETKNIHWWYVHGLRTENASTTLLSYPGMNVVILYIHELSFTVPIFTALKTPTTSGTGVSSITIPSTLPRPIERNT